jgi:predicted DNA-binding protein (UPF0251 family)
MPKPKKKRQVQHPPYVIFFKPQGIPMVHLDQMILTIDEYEAIRLADHEGMKHNEASEMMNISRPTFTRLLNDAHSKVADAIVNGKAVKIEGGNFTFLKNKLLCNSCNNIWTVSSNSSPGTCPECNNDDIIDLSKNCRPGRGRNRNICKKEEQQK